MQSEQVKAIIVQDYRLVSVVRTVHTRRKPLVVIIIGVAVLTAVVTLFLKNYYSSTTIFYAASQDLFKPQKVFGYSQTEMYYYGGTEDIQRVLTAASSHQVVDHLIQEFNLYEHYGIKKGSSKAEYKVREKFRKHYSIMRTKYDAIELTIEDTDPELAARMANAARAKINDVLTEIIKSSQRDLLSSYQAAIVSKEFALGAVEDSLRKFQSLYGIYDPEAQAEYLSTLITSVEARMVKDRGALESLEKFRSEKGVRDSIIYLNASIAGLEMQHRLLTGRDTSSQNSYSLDRFASGRSRVDLYTDAYKKAVNTLNVDKEMLKQMEAALALDVTALHLVEEGSVPEKKTRPRRSLIVLSVTVFATILSLLWILLAESFKEEDWTFLKW